MANPNSSPIIELTSLKKVNPPCCICYVQKANKSIVEYKCGQCQEGVVCLDCAAKLWKTNSRHRCPICNFSPTPPDTWYKSYDVEMGYIRPPSIDENEAENNGEENEQIDGRGLLCAQRERGLLCYKENLLLLCIIIIFGLFISFIIGTVFKAVKGECAWNCKDENMGLTIGSSIAYGIIGIPVIILCLSMVALVIGIIYETIIGCLIKIRREINNYEVNNGVRLRDVCEQIILHKVKTFVLFVCFTVASFCTGTLFKIANEMCYWKCKDEAIAFTIFTSTLVGMPILLMSMIFILIVFACISMCFIVCMEMGTPNH